MFKDTAKGATHHADADTLKYIAELENRVDIAESDILRLNEYGCEFAIDEDLMLRPQDIGITGQELALKLKKFLDMELARVKKGGK
jgi:hypothetical protein